MSKNRLSTALVPRQYRVSTAWVPLEYSLSTVEYRARPAEAEMRDLAAVPIRLIQHIEARPGL